MGGTRRHAGMAPVIASVVLLFSACGPTAMSLSVRDDRAFTPAEVGGALRSSGHMRHDFAGSRAADGPSPMPGASRVVVPSTHTITVFPNGMFTPSSLTINEGDSVHFVGPSGIAGIIPLRTTDAIVRVNQADIDAAALSGTACMTSTLPYTTDHMLPGDENEITGPLRRATSGIYALGPERSDGYFEGPAADTCETIFAAAGSPLAEGETAHVVEFPGYEDIVAGAATKLCYKEFRGEKSNRTNSPYVLQSTWDNPDVTGAVIRINWEDLYTRTRVGDVETYTKNWSKLDTELENAAKRGKLVFLEILAGDGIPPWIFNDYVPLVDATATGLVAKSVIPIATSDFGTSSDTTMPTNRSCGYDKTMGSPADDAYKTALLTMLRDVAARIRGHARHYQALGSLKVTGLNFLTGEMRLPKRCLDPRAMNANGSSQSTCFCNTRIWATSLGTQVVAYDDPNLTDDVVPPTVFGGGYTAEIAQNFINAVENTIYVELGRRKTMHYMLIQDGFPKVFDANHYDMDSGAVFPNLGYVDAMGDRIPFDQQTVDALDGGQAGNFRKVNADGSPNLAGGLDPDAPALFSPMHAALGPIPVVPLVVWQNGQLVPIGLNACYPKLPTALVDGKTEGVVVDPADPIAATNFNDYSSRGGCPNKWAAREGFEGQIIGYQTQNDLTGPDDLSSALWNATLNSNAVFVEVYEKVLWISEQHRLAGNTVLSTTSAGYAGVPERQKSLAQWTSELHKRRRTIADFASNADNRHMKDPFPDRYTFTFKKNLAPGVVESHFFINPGARCTAGTLFYGRIDVTGK
jgi:hypothetical protein